MMHLFRFLSLLGFLILSPRQGAHGAQDCPVHILHTNDLHSHLTGSSDPELGGYAQIKAKLDELRATRPVSMSLDAGDFSEGSEFFFARRGLNIFQILNRMGYDAVTLGNHDYLQGANHLNWIYSILPATYSLLGANFSTSHAYRALQNTLRPYTTIERNGVRFAILGLTTDDIFYRWRVENDDEAMVFDPITSAMMWIPRIRESHDFVIVLSHLGFDKDKELVRQVGGIDLVVGGHSHTLLRRPALELSPDGKPVPIVQTGAHGQYIGDLELNACRGQPLELKTYQLHPVQTRGSQDPVIARRVADTSRALDEEYPEWPLNREIAQSEVALRPAGGISTEWSDLTAEAFRRSGNAELGLDLQVFAGLDRPAGPITRRDLVTLYPRRTGLHERYGWTVQTVLLPGWMIQTIVNTLVSLPNPFSVSGMQVDVEPVRGQRGKLRLKRILVGSDRTHAVGLRGSRMYRIALPQGLVGEALKAIPALRLISRRPTDTGIPIWHAIENELLRRGGRLSAYTSWEQRSVTIPESVPAVR